jgi:hypothetical protein
MRIEEIGETGERLRRTFGRCVAPGRDTGRLRRSVVLPTAGWWVPAQLERNPKQISNLKFEISKPAA